MAAALAKLGFRKMAPGPGALESLSVGGGRHKITWSRPAMGTLVTVTAMHRSRELAEDAAGRAFQEMDRLVALLSRYESSSALSVLNREGVIRSPPPELRSVVSGALRFHAVSKGAFDPTVRPLVDLFRARMGTGGGGLALRTPGGEADTLTHSDRELLHVLDLVDARRVKLRRHAIRFNREGMGMTLDGIAKGYVVDRMAEILMGRGLKDFLIDAGGDIRSAGRREDGRPWQVAVQDPAKEGAFPDLIGLTDGAVATSGSYENYFQLDRSRHHIVNGRGGASPSETLSVSVVAPTALAADALATAVFVMGQRAGTALIDSLSGCACLVIDGLGRPLQSARWRSARGRLTSKAGAP
jgi:FAD:protein FMN transferase